MSFKAAMFDLDGTLVDTIEDLADSMNSVLERCGFPSHDLDAYKYFVGDGMINLVRRSLPEQAKTDETVMQCLAMMREEYAGRWKEKSRPYDGIPELLDRLSERGIKMAVLSNKPDDFTKVMVRELLSRWRFEAVLGERPSIPRKPDPISALEIAGQMRVSPGDFLYLGDTSTDMKTAGAAGMYAVGVLWGFRKADELLAGGARLLIERPTDLLELIDG
jgi:phosphoglycolate phosphatase